MTTGSSMEFFGLILCMCTASVAEVIYTNNWAVRVSGTDPETIHKIVMKHGFINLGKIFPDGNVYHMVGRKVPKQSLQANNWQNVLLETDPQVLWHAQQSGMRRVRRNVATIGPTPNDPLYSQQWYLSDAFNHNILAAWAQGYTGKGVVVSILDDGLETSHPDFAGNYDPFASYDMNDNDPNPDAHYSLTKPNRHGTLCAGVVAAVAHNGVCGVGVAHQAKIGGKWATYSGGTVRMLDGFVTDLIEAKSLNWNQQHVDIYSSSWGPEDLGRTVEGPSTLTQEAFIRGVNHGRGGLGSIYVWASGNGGSALDNCNCDGYANSIYTLAVGSATERGTLPFYSEPCSAILAATYSGGSAHHRKIVTTDHHHSCTSEHTGTSASAPLAAGIVALALQANPTLTWRDVQHLTVRASRPAELITRDWRANGVGRTVSHYYGYGLMDAGRMVDLARKWRAVRPQRMCIVDVVAKPLELRKRLTLRWNETACPGTKNWIRSLEHLQVRLSLTASRRGDLSISLISAMGTTSDLLTPRPYDRSAKGFSNWAFMSTHCWDENPSGEWVLQIVNHGESKNRGILSSFRLILYGTDEHVAGRRTERTVVHRCAMNSTGGCTGCAFPLLEFGRVCLVACPPHYYESDGNSSTLSPRTCLPCHQSCLTCSGKQNTNCLDCPVYSALDPASGTCAPPVYAWHHRSKTPGVEHMLTRAAVQVALVVPLTMWCVMWVMVLMLSGPFAPRVAPMDPSGSEEEEAQTGEMGPGRTEEVQAGEMDPGSTEEARAVQMVVLRMPEQAEEVGQGATFTGAAHSPPET